MSTRRISLLAKAFALTLAVYLLGPILTALVQAELRSAFPPSFNPVRSRHLVARGLARLYDEEHPPSGADTFDFNPDRSCGYDVVELLAKVPSVRSTDGKTRSSFAERGDFYVETTADELANANIEEKRAVGLETSLGAFGLWFTTDCINSTILTRVCNAHLEHLIERIDSEPSPAIDHLGADVWARARCTYLDGVAARLGLPLPKRAGPM